MNWSSNDFPEDYTVDPAPYQVGARVKTNRAWPGVPLGTEGLICEDYGSGVTVAWDKPEKPIPDLPPETIGKLWAIEPQCPDRDGFDKSRELIYLDIVR